MMRKSSTLLLMLILPVLLMISCHKEISNDIYLSRNSLKNKKITRLFQLLEEEKSEEEQFGIMEQLIYQLRKNNEKEALSVFLMDYTAERPQDTYLAYYFLTLANYYKEKEQPEAAAYYFRRILRESQDLFVKGESIHYTCLKELIAMETSPRELLWCYNEILNRFSSEMDPGICYFYMAEYLESLGEWEEAIEYFKRFQKYPKTVIPDVPGVHEVVSRKVSYYNSRINWAYEDLEDLIAKVRYAVYYRKGNLLPRYQAPKFFIMSWTQKTTDRYTHVDADLGSYLTKKTRVHSQVENYSNDQEAYLRSWGWREEYRVGVFYLYFRRIDLPERPDIHGKWEWAGVYLGERR